MCERSSGEGASLRPPIQHHLGQVVVPSTMDCASEAGLAPGAPLQHGMMQAISSGTFQPLPRLQHTEFMLHRIVARVELSVVASLQSVIARSVVEVASDYVWTLAALNPLARCGGQLFVVGLFRGCALSWRRRAFGAVQQQMDRRCRHLPCPDPGLHGGFLFVMASLQPPLWRPIAFNERVSKHVGPLKMGGFCSLPKPTTRKGTRHSLRPTHVTGMGQVEESSRF